MNVPALQPDGPSSPMPTVTGTMDIVRAALATGNVEMYREAVSLAKELDAIAARKAYDNALADAKAEIPVIRKNREVDFTSQKGRTNYKHEDLAEIARTVSPILGKHGLSYRFRVTSEPNDPVRVTCIISHRAGHFEETTLSAGRDESGSKNSIQAVGSTLTYLQRMTLKAALGLAASDDNDGANADGVPTTITAIQMQELEALIVEVNAKTENICKACHVETLAEMTQKQFDKAKAKLETMRAPL